MATRCQFENSNDVGVFAKLTNAYAICALVRFFSDCHGGFSVSCSVCLCLQCVCVCVY